MCLRACRWVVTTLASFAASVAIAQQANPVPQNAPQPGALPGESQQSMTPQGGVQQNAQVPAQQAPAAAVQQVPGPFQLNVLQQAALDQALNAWQKSSGNISTFQCAFERWE